MTIDTEEDDRRQFLKSCGRFAAVTPPALTVLLSTSLTSTAIAASGGRVASSGSGNKRSGLFDNGPDDPPLHFDQGNGEQSRQVSGGFPDQGPGGGQGRHVSGGGGGGSGGGGDGSDVARSGRGLSDGGGGSDQGNGGQSRQFVGPATDSDGSGLYGRLPQ